MTLPADKVMVVIIGFGQLKEAPAVFKWNALNNSDALESFQGAIHGHEVTFRETSLVSERRRGNRTIHRHHGSQEPFSFPGHAQGTFFDGPENTLEDSFVVLHRFLKVAFIILASDTCFSKHKKMSTDLSQSIFAKRERVEQVEEGDRLAPKFDQQGTIPCVTVHAMSREVLMFAFMSPEALKLTIETGLAHYWSRSRQQPWKKGESSGMFQRVKRMLIDDDQDCVVLEVELTEPNAGGREASCHVGYRSCFYREVPIGKADGSVRLRFVEEAKAFDPQAVYGDAPNPTQL